jgi:hypothetical protein
LTNKGEKPVGLVCKGVLQGLSEESVRQVGVDAGATSRVSLQAVFKESLSTISEQRPGAICWSVETTDGKRLAGDTKAITIASRNDMLLDKDHLDSLCVFITPNDPVIDQFLGKFLKLTVGYQHGEKGVYGQMAAVYNALNQSGVHYSNRTISYLHDKNMQSQRVYFPRESLQSTNANCIDGTVLFASIFEKMGLRTYIVLVPGHAFLAVNLRAQGNEVVLPLETTKLGSGDFNAAIDAGSAAWDNAAASKQILVLDVENSRRAGILPYPYYEQLGVPQKFAALSSLPGSPEPEISDAGIKALKTFAIPDPQK